MAGTMTPQAPAADPDDGNGGPPPLMDQRGGVAKSGMDKVLGRLPNLLSSKPVIIFGIVLFCYLFLYAGIASLLGHPGAVSANTQLILGNYTNVSSSVGAGIAAGAGLTLLRRQNRTHRLAVRAHDAALEAKGLAEETHRILHLAFPEHAAALGQHPGRVTRPARGGAEWGGTALREAVSGGAGASSVPGAAAFPSGTAPGPAAPPSSDAAPDAP